MYILIYHLGANVNGNFLTETVIYFLLLFYLIKHYSDIMICWFINTLNFYILIKLSSTSFLYFYKILFTVILYLYNNFVMIDTKLYLFFNYFVLLTTFNKKHSFVVF